jgi:alpha(1,3/1,4) fucosyltransferase
MNMINIAYVNYWERSVNNIQDNWFSNFITINIGQTKEVSINENPDILICSCFGQKNIKNIKAKIKIYFYGENFNRYPPYNNINFLTEIFDIIIGFKYTDIKNKILRFPLWLIYYDYYNMNNKNDNIITYIENEYNKNIKIEKTILGSLVSNHDKGGQRIILLKELEKYGKVLCPSHFNNNCNKILPDNKSKINFIKQTKCNICPENSADEGYFTEKIFQAFEGGNIPIYWAIDEPEKDILNKNKYCFIKNINDKEEVEKKIKDVIENPVKYLDGYLFKENAYEIVAKYYNDLINRIIYLLSI